MGFSREGSRGGQFLESTMMRGFILAVVLAVWAIASLADATHNQFGGDIYGRSPYCGGYSPYGYYSGHSLYGHYPHHGRRPYDLIYPYHIPHPYYYHNPYCR